MHDDGDAMRPPQPPPREEPPMISPHRNWGDCDLDLEYEDEGSSSSSSSSSNNDRNDRRWRPEPRENSPSSPSTARAAAAAAATTTSASATKRRMNAVASHSDTLPSPKGNEDDVNGNDGYTFDGSTQMTTVARSRRRRSKARLCYWSLALATTGILAFLQREIVWSSTLFAVGGGGAGAGRRVPAAATLELQVTRPFLGNGWHVARHRHKSLH